MKDQPEDLKRTKSRIDSALPFGKGENYLFTKRCLSQLRNASVAIRFPAPLRCTRSPKLSSEFKAGSLSRRTNWALGSTRLALSRALSKSWTTSCVRNSRAYVGETGRTITITEPCFCARSNMRWKAKFLTPLNACFPWFSLRIWASRHSVLLGVHSLTFASIVPKFITGSLGSTKEFARSSAAEDDLNRWGSCLRSPTRTASDCPAVGKIFWR